MCDQVIVDICNQIVGGKLFATLDDIRKQPIGLTANDEAFHELIEGGNFLLSMKRTYSGLDYHFVDKRNPEDTVVLCCDNKQPFLCGVKTFVSETDNTYITANIEKLNTPESTGSVHMQVSNNNVVISNAKVKGIKHITMGGYVFDIPVFDDRLFVRESYRQFFKAVYDLTGVYADEQYVLFMLHFYIDRAKNTAVMNMSQVCRTTTDSNEVTFNIDLSDGSKMDFGTLDESKKELVMDLIIPLIDAAV